MLSNKRKIEKNQFSLYFQAFFSNVLIAIWKLAVWHQFCQRWEGKAEYKQVVPVHHTAINKMSKYPKHF